MTTDDHAWLTVPEAARELRVSVPTVWRWIRANRLTATRIGVRSVRVRRSELEALTQPVAEQARRGRPETSGKDGRSLYIKVGHPSLSTDELLTRLRQHQQAILKRRGGVPLPDSAPLIRQIREEHGDVL
jgi:excisionase family DNA binding protein